MALTGLERRMIENVQNQRDLYVGITISPRRLVRAAVRLARRLHPESEAVSTWLRLKKASLA